MMNKSYYRLSDDINFPERWYLGDVINEDNWQYTKGQNIDNTKIKQEIEVYQDGREMDFTLNEAYAVPIVSSAFRDMVSIFSNLTFIPVSIKNKDVSTNYYIMVVEQLLQAVDEAQSEFNKFEPNDPVRPDKAGEYRAFFKLIIDSSIPETEDIFRLKGSRQSLIISDVFKSKVDSLTGCDFELVSN